MNIEHLQKLARSHYAQIYYNRAKEIGTLHLFENDKDLSKIQIMYLYYLEIYGVLFNDLNLQEKYISEAVIEDDIRTEAYLLYRKEKRLKKSEDETQKHIDSNYGEGSIVFRRKSGK
jgi:hypothetical protein